MPVIPHSAKLRISYADMVDLYHALDLWRKLHDRTLTCHYIIRTVRPASSRPGGLSVIERILNAAGYQVGTIHRIYARDGGIVHEDPEGLIVGDVLLWRQGHE